MAQPSEHVSVPPSQSFSVERSEHAPIAMDLEQHLRRSTDTFMLAEGTKGMVMVVFTLPSFPYVFKVIRDWFAPPKDTDRKSVEERYKFVKLNDRVGRMSDTLEYAHVAFPKERLDNALIAELEKLAPSVLESDGDLRRRPPPQELRHHSLRTRRLLRLRRAVQADRLPLPDDAARA